MTQNRSWSEQCALDFMHEVKSLIANAGTKPIYGGSDTEVLVARLRQLAAGMIRLIDSAEKNHWDVHDLLRLVNRKRDIDYLLAMPRDDYEGDFDKALVPVDDDELFE
jgi:hypothetical protein